MKVQVFVRLKPGVLDVQGKAVEHSMHGLGFKEVRDVRVGQLIEFEVDASTAEVAKLKTEELCKLLLANTVIENYEIRGL